MHPHCRMRSNRPSGTPSDSQLRVTAWVTGQFSGASCSSDFPCRLRQKESRRADSNRFPAHYECAVSGCPALLGFAYPAWAMGIPFPALPTIAGHCVRVRVKLGSTKGFFGRMLIPTPVLVSRPQLLYRLRLVSLRARLQLRMSYAQRPQGPRFLVGALAVPLPSHS